jgi:hypothetical protein
MTEENHEELCDYNRSLRPEFKIGPPSTKQYCCLQHLSLDLRGPRGAMLGMHGNYLAFRTHVYGVIMQGGM